MVERKPRSRAAFRYQSRSEYEAELARVKKEMDAFLSHQAERIGRMAIDAGLLDLEMSDDELKAGLADMVVRFRAREPAPIVGAGAAEAQPTA